MKASQVGSHSLAARARRSVAACTACVLAFASVDAATTGEPEQAPPAGKGTGESTVAVWKYKEVDFIYRSNLAIYSCTALESRVASILRGVGARDDVDVRVSDCREVLMPQDDTLDPWRTSTKGYLDRRNREQLAHVRVRLQMPVEMTPDIVAELERDQARRELISRVTRDPAAKSDHPVVFPAQRQPVTLSRKTIGIEPEECELLDQIATSVFPQLDVRVVRRAYSCSKYQVSRIPPQMTVEALMEVPHDVRLPNLTPGAASESQAETGSEAASSPPPAQPDPGAPAESATPTEQPSAPPPQ
jgi:hypothetical protein